MTLDSNHSLQARSYLQELNREDVIPVEALSPEFAAKAEFARWLSHPNELGRPPDELEVFDHRLLRWPPDFEELPVWLFRYKVRSTSLLDPDDIGVGMVGSTTWCAFSWKIEQRPPEDGYALHWIWESKKYVAFHEIEAHSREYDGMLAQWTGAPLASVRLAHVAEVASKLQYSQKLVAIADAQMDGKPGWVALDGPQSRWYPAAEFPADERSKTVLEIHLGRRILGLPLSAQRSEFVLKAEPRDREQIIAGYEGLLQEVLSTPANTRAAGLAEHSHPLSKHFEAYVDAIATARNREHSAVVASTYEKILNASRETVPASGDEAMDSFTPVGERFDLYVDALIQLGRSVEVISLAKELAPHWQHNLGYARLGAAAFRGGDLSLSESLLLKLKSECANWQRFEEMALLAEIWHRRGDTKPAIELMIDCLRKTLAEAEDATGSDIEFHEKIYQRRRRDFLRIFDGTEDSFAALGLPESTLPK